MPQLTPQQLREFAHLGAEARLAQLDAEIAAIKSTYPGLARASATAEPATRKAPAPAKRRKPYRMSPEARKAAAERMRKYWADRKAAQQSGQPQAAAQPNPRGKRKAARRKRSSRKRR